MTTCPVCGSESFTYISRWVPVPEGETPKRPERTEPPEQARVYRQLLDSGEKHPRGGKLLRGGLLGLTALGLAGWAWRSSRKTDGDTES